MRIKAKVAYDGTEWEGWQSQVNGKTIQDVLEKRLGYLLEVPTRIYGASRTDAGVHARGQVFHFDADWQHPLEHLLRGFRSNIPPSIQVQALEPAGSNFHARKEARGKRYIYYLREGEASPFEWRYCWSLGRRRLNLESMREGARHLEGTHDFSAFAGRSPKAQDPNPVKTIYRIEIRGECPYFEIVSEGSGYLYKMVRSMAGALIDVGIGRLEPGDLAKILHSRERTAQIRTAPARGLFLDEVFYGRKEED